MVTGRFHLAEGLDALRRAVAQVLLTDLGLAPAAGAPGGATVPGPRQSWLLSEAALHEVAPDPGTGPGDHHHATSSLEDEAEGSRRGEQGLPRNGVAVVLDAYGT